MFLGINNEAVKTNLTREERCKQYGNKRVVLFGPPGSGKGTQSERMIDELCSCHISTGDLLRKEIKDQTEYGRKAKDIMDRGDLVPDDLVIDILGKKLKSEECQTGAIFDGYPRTVEQAKKLDSLLNQSGQKLDKVFNFEVDDETLIKRISGRRVHEPSGRSYHVLFKPPKKAGFDDVTGEPLIQRKDDKPETVLNRLQTYQKLTRPVLDYYKSSGLLYNLDAKRDISDVWKDISKQIFN